jgi:hypothetical protein
LPQTICTNVVGTPDYASAQVLTSQAHAMVPKDDFESLAYTLLVLANGCAVPWTSEVRAGMRSERRGADGRTPFAVLAEARKAWVATNVLAKGTNGVSKLFEAKIDVAHSRAKAVTFDANDFSALVQRPKVNPRFGRDGGSDGGGGGGGEGGGAAGGGGSAVDE